MTTTSRAWARRVAIGLAALAFLLGGAYLLRRPVLRAVGGALTHEDPVMPSDALVVLTGGEETRPFHAARLYRAGVARQVLIAREQPSPTERLGLTPNGSRIAIDVMLRLGVPDSAIRVLPGPGVTSTREEAAAMAEYFVSHGLRRVTIVTSPFHTRRARYAFSRHLDGDSVEVRMVGAPEWQFDADRWWESEVGISSYGMEVLKWIHTAGVLR